AMENDPLLKKAVMTYPNMTQLLFDRSLSDVIEANSQLKIVLEKNSSLEELIRALPGMDKTIAENPDLISQANDMTVALSDQLKAQPRTQELLGNLKKLAGSGFVDSWGGALKDMYDVGHNAVQY